MKNLEKHQSLSDSHVRDFLAKKVGYSFEGEVEMLTDQIAALQQQLETAKESRAALELIKSRGWKDFDVSESIDDYSRSSYFPFIGTDEEYASIFNKGESK